MQAIIDLLPFAFLFGAVALFVLGLGSLIPFDGMLKHRLKGETETSLSSKRVLRPEDGAIEKLLALPFARHFFPVKEGELSTQRLNLVRAGYFSPSAPAIYYASRILLAFTLPVIVIMVTALLSLSLSQAGTMLVIILPGLFGYMLPTLIVSSRVNARQQAVRHTFPDALDMLLMCVEAGIGLDEALIRVSAELRANHPILSEHFDKLTSELRAGKTRDNAFRSFSDRIGLDEIQSFITLLKQTEELGTSMSASLRAMSDDMRQRRMMRAEEMAQKVSTKLSMLMMVFILPVLLMVIMAPAVISAMQHYGVESSSNSQDSRSARR